MPLLLFPGGLPSGAPVDVTMIVATGYFALAGEDASLFPQAPDLPASTGIHYRPLYTRRR